MTKILSPSNSDAAPAPAECRHRTATPLPPKKGSDAERVMHFCTCPLLNSQVHRSHVVSLETCAGCHPYFRNSPGRKPQSSLAERTACIHRGGKTDSAPCAGCGGQATVPVFLCDVHGECIKLTTDRQRLSDPSTLPADAQARQSKLLKQRSCEGCQEREAREARQEDS